MNNNDWMLVTAQDENTVVNELHETNLMKLPLVEDECCLKLQPISVC
jgi:hypothetical protein